MAVWLRDRGRKEGRRLHRRCQRDQKATNCCSSKQQKKTKLGGLEKELNNSFLWLLKGAAIKTQAGLYELPCTDAKSSQLRGSRLPQSPLKPEYVHTACCLLKGTFSSRSSCRHPGHSGSNTRRNFQHWMFLSWSRSSSLTECSTSTVHYMKISVCGPERLVDRKYCENKRAKLSDSK